MSEIKRLTQKELEERGKELFDKLHKKNEYGISPIMTHNLGVKSGEWDRCEDEEEKKKLSDEIKNSTEYKALIAAIEKKLEELKGGE